MSKYARGKRAFGFCDRTGFRYPLNELVYEFQNGVKTGLRVGKDMADPDHPQNFTGRVDTNDPQSLFDPRPDTNRDTGLFGFNPVGNPATFMRISHGKVTVAITDPDDTFDDDLTLEGDAMGSLELEGDVSGDLMI